MAKRLHEERKRCEDRIADAREVIDAAKANLVGHYLDDSAPAVSVEDGERDLDSAKRAFIAINEAQNTVDEQLKNASPVVGYRQRDIVEVLKDLMDEEGVAGDLVEAVQRTQREYLKTARVLHYLYDLGVLRSSNTYCGQWNAVEYARCELQSSPMTWHMFKQVQPEIGSWHDALVALQQDAMAPLPDTSKL